MSQSPSYQSLLAEMVDVIRKDVGMGEALAIQFADIICSGLSRRNPSTYIYVPAVFVEQRRAMYAAIAAEFNGRNLREICHRYGVSKTTVYRARTLINGPLKKREDENLQKLQSTLF